MTCSPFDLLFPNAPTTFPFRNNVNLVMKLSSKLESILKYFDANKSDFSFDASSTGSTSFSVGPNTTQIQLFELLTQAVKDLLKNFIDNYMNSVPKIEDLVSFVTLMPGYLTFVIELDVTSGDKQGKILIPFPAYQTPSSSCGDDSASRKPIYPSDFNGIVVYTSIQTGVLVSLTQAFLSLDIPSLVITMLTLTQEATGKNGAGINPN